LIHQIALGSALLMFSIVIQALTAMLLEVALVRHHAWLTREPHRLKLVIVVIVVGIAVLGVITLGAWIWALMFHVLGVFPTLEESLYFALVSFTTLGFGDVLLPKEWRLLAGMAAANGLLNFGLLTALLVEALRHIRIKQSEVRRPRGD
jgi:polyferredoxin